MKRIKVAEAVKYY